MQVFIYQSALLCKSCGEAARAKLDSDGKRPPVYREESHNVNAFGEASFHPDKFIREAHESTFDSDDYPKGPYPDGGGEADCPQHCDTCGEFLGNPLTDDGRQYVRDALARAPDSELLDAAIKDSAR